MKNGDYDPWEFSDDPEDEQCQHGRLFWHCEECFPPNVLRESFNFEGSVRGKYAERYKTGVKVRVETP